MDDIVKVIRDIARKHGWAIGVHGSMVRDIDLIGIPWTDDAIEPESLVDNIISETGYTSHGHKLGNHRPGGRRTILLMHPDATFIQTEKGTWNPPAIDLSLMYVKSFKDYGNARCGICCPSRIGIPKDENGCILKDGHEGPHKFLTADTIITWETDLDCNCEDCMSGESFEDNCISFTTEKR